MTEVRKKWEQSHSVFKTEQMQEIVKIADAVVEKVPPGDSEEPEIMLTDMELELKYKSAPLLEAELYRRGVWTKPYFKYNGKRIGHTFRFQGVPSSDAWSTFTHFIAHKFWQNPADFVLTILLCVVCIGFVALAYTASRK